MNESMMKQNVDIYGATDVGRRRKNNEDNLVCQFVWDDSHILLAAIDGIGGYEGGEVAAEICRDTLIAYVGSASASSRQLDVIKQAVIEANNAIIRAKESQQELSMMGCVVTAGIIDIEARLLHMAHVGDSRLYSFHEGVLTKLSHDHSLVGFREEIGDLTEEEAMHHPQRNLIERSCGDVIHMFEDQNFIDAAIFPIPSGDTSYLFCSDGLSDMLTSAQISSVLSKSGSANESVDLLIQAANEAGGRDNITAVVANIHYPETIDVISGDLPETDMLEVEEKTTNDPVIASDEAMQRLDESTRRRMLRVRVFLPWIIVVILLGVIAALVFKFYVFEMAPVQSEPISVEEIVEVNDTIVNELDTASTTSVGDSSSVAVGGDSLIDGSIENASIDNHE